MTPQQMLKIFDPFTQADTSTTRKYGGTGLGLSISKRLAEAVGGSLEVSSELHVGTRFTFTLAIEVAHDTQILSPDEAMTWAEGARAKEFYRVALQGTRVLVVDDGETNRNLITLLLEDSGGVVFTATNGEEAVDQLIQQKLDVDVVLMDMQMPVMDGYRAARVLREIGYDRPIVALTANAMLGDEARCRQSGCTEYVTKPIDLDALLKIVCNASGKCHFSPGTNTRRHTSLPSMEASTCELPQTSADTGNRQVNSGSVALRYDGPILPEDWLRDFACDLVDKISDVLPSILEANESGDLDEVARQLHWIKGSGGTVGLGHLTDLAAGGEEAIANANHEQVLATLNEIQSYLSRAREESSRSRG